jgi:ribosomal protein S18 acetylase RimI-like enzyme
VIRRAEPADRSAVEDFLARHHSLRVARLGRVEAPLEHPALLAVEDGRVIGVLTYVVDGDACEVLTLNVEDRRRGLGTALMEAAAEIASGAGCARLWLITTNDNLDALRFYQRRGLRLAALHAAAVDDARARLKPEIPPIGEYGIPLRDELELELNLAQ